MFEHSGRNNCEWVGKHARYLSVLLRCILGVFNNHQTCFEADGSYLFSTLQLENKKPFLSYMKKQTILWFGNAQLLSK